MKEEISKNKIGRPTNYSGDLCVMANQYLEEFQEDEPVPTIAGLACFIKIPRQKIYDYKLKHEEFRDIIENLLALQEKKLLMGSLNNKLNSKISTLMLSKHGYVNKESIEHSGSFSLSKLLEEADKEESGGKKADFSQEE